jgi:serine/threonine-protein kinase
MAPEQFEGRAVFASDLYSLGITMYQMLTGDLPYDTPAPSDLDRLRTGELVRPLRTVNPAIPPVLDDIVMKTLAADVAGRYQRAEDLLTDLIKARPEIVKRPQSEPVAAAAAPRASSPRSAPRPITPAPVRTRDVAAGRFCWHCRKPLPTRTSRCPFCGETQ